MAKYRHVHTTFWNDPLILDLTPEQKYFYLYLMTNDKVKQCGIYEISLRQIAYQTGYNKDTILNLLDFFEKLKKIVYSPETNEILLLNFLKYNSSKSPKVIKCIDDELKKVKNPKLIDLLNGINTVSIDYTNDIDKKKKKKKKNKKEKENDFINKVQEYNDEFKDIITSFIDYWTESNVNSELLRFEKEKVFDLKKRLVRWSNNNFNKKNNEMPDFYDSYYLNRIKDDIQKVKEFEKHLIDNCGYEKKVNSYDGKIKWIKRK